MANESPGPTKRTWLDCPVVATADRLVIRPPIGYFGVAGLFLLFSLLLPWIMAEVGLLDRVIRMRCSLMAAAGVMFFAILLGRWWTLDRTTGQLVEGSEQPTEITEVWTFMRERGGNWELSAIQQTN